MGRAGYWVEQLEGYTAFIPNPLPPEPPLEMNEQLMRLLSDADRALGRLDGVASVLPNPNLFVAMYVRWEAVLSSQIEGTQSTLEDILEFEADGHTNDPHDVEEVVNYVAAMNHGLARLDDLPVCNRLVLEIHEKLMQGVRGGDREPGSFRRSQNWIGPAGCNLRTASFVPPPPHELGPAMGALEKFLHDRTLPPLLHVGVAHAQFETIHPFLDGNGRVGRLLITLLLCERQILQRPLLYLSLFLKTHRAEYYDRLTAVRSSGDWEGWLRFFLRGVVEVSREATETARKILTLREEARAWNMSQTAGSLLEHMFEHPVVSVPSACKALDCSFGAANTALSELEERGLVEETTGKKRNRRFAFRAYLRLFHQPGLADEEGPVDGQSTQHPP